ncbi:aspartic proteinase PCS1 [Impatiens glandulifera]|uniref:aspartic proteinase PCS1 n=1 Tax=Impatiens glandulifera TaxID=253017 RepID=UPI001FB0CDD5|nr:aspartic proteinase PCS1 [Impatiens glandulifera]
MAAALFFFLLANFFSPAVSSSLSLSFPLKAISLSPKTHLSSSPLLENAISVSPAKKPAAPAAAVSSPPYSYKTSFRYSMALIVSLPIGTPPQTQQMVLDTGSQLSWIQCDKKKPPPTTTFDPSLSSSFSLLPCTHPLCKPRVPDFSLPTSCDQNRLCHYSYFYADGTLAEGNLVREKFTFSNTQTTPPLILGCAADSDSSNAQGILGMNRGRLSFASQARVSKYSYCVPPRRRQNSTAAMTTPEGTFYLGDNPNSHSFQYVNILTFLRPQQMPNLDPYAYTLPLMGLRLGSKRLNISTWVFRPDAGGSGQTMIDSGSEFTYLVDEAYSKVKGEIVSLVGNKMKKDYVYESSLEMCFDGNPIEIGRLIGDLVFEFEKGVEISIGKEKVLNDVGGGIHCVGISQSSFLGIASNIIGNVHQQDLWVEYDVVNRKVGFGRAVCSGSG